MKFSTKIENWKCFYFLRENLLKTPINIFQMLKLAWDQTFSVTLVFLDFLCKVKNISYKYVWAIMGHKTQANLQLFGAGFYRKCFCAFLHELSFQFSTFETIFEVKASKKSEEIRWMICIYLVAWSYWIYRGFFCFLEKS